jgi:hypothetical protein
MNKLSDVLIKSYNNHNYLYINWRGYGRDLFDMLSSIDGLLKILISIEEYEILTCANLTVQERRIKMKEDNSFYLPLSAEATDLLLVDMLKHSYKEHNYCRYDEGKEYLDSNDELLDSILGVLSWYMPHSEYEEFVKNNPKATP